MSLREPREGGRVGGTVGGNDGRGISQYNASRLELQRRENKQMQENVVMIFNMKNKQIQHKGISEAYTTAKDMLCNYGEYMDVDEKIGWYKVMKEKALILTGRHNHNRPTFFTPSPHQRYSSISFYDSNTTTEYTSYNSSSSSSVYSTSVPPTLPHSRGPRNGATNAHSHPRSSRGRNDIATFPPTLPISRGPRNDTATVHPTLPPPRGSRNDTATNHLLSDHCFQSQNYCCHLELTANSVAQQLAEQ